MQAAFGWVLWLISLLGLSNDPLWNINIKSPLNGAVISQTPQNKISVSGAFYRKGNALPPIKGSVVCNGVHGIINKKKRTWSATGISLIPGRNIISCDYKDRKLNSHVQIEVTYKGGSTQPPVSSFTVSPLSGPAPLSVSFNASASNDPDGGSIVSYEWTFGDGSTLTTASPVVSHLYEGVGSFNAKLQVRDDEGILSNPVTQTIVTFAQNIPPVAQIAANPASGFAPLNVQFNGASSYDEDGSISRYQ